MSALFDIALPVVHGTNVEDGTLMGLLEMLGVAYTGCDVTSSALDGQIRHEGGFAAGGAAVLDAMVFTGRQFAMDEDDILNRIEQGLGYPVVVKPVNLGSSVGISLAADRAALKSAMDTALGFSPGSCRTRRAEPSRNQLLGARRH